MLSVGDYVFYKAETFPVIVTSMQIVQTGEKYGAAVAEATVLDRSLVVCLGDGRWGYGDQIELVGHCKLCDGPIERGCAEHCLRCEKIEADVINELMEDQDADP